MNIALTEFHHDWGGQPLQVLLLARALRDAGHAVTVLAPPESETIRRCRACGLDVFDRCAFTRGFRPLALKRDFSAFRRCLRERAIGVVHCHGSQDTWLAAMSRALGGPRFALIRTKHNSYPVQTHAANRWLYGRAIDRVIAVADTIRRDLVDCGLVAPSRIATIHAGLDDDFGNDVPDDARTTVRREFGIPDHAPVIGLVGRLAKDKGQEILLKALPRVREAVPGCHALLIGTGGDYHRQLALRSELGLDDCAHYPLFRDDVARLTAACDASVLAATACDASSTVVKEAMRLGVPVVATDVGGTREILDNGDCGWVIPPDDPSSLADALVFVLDRQNAENVRARTAAARERVEREYAMPKIAQATLRAYEEAQQTR